ncbi:aquaporin [Salsipaludibacter albus]|uniref:aquaporin n=1 Tax=Salsipaludibacter albus TaxID=2849650 RepID=UPI001EE43349|nr:MIP/aquaporin family protein [Salsipaludibacter albus]
MTTAAALPRRDPARRLVAEGLGTAVLLLAVVGSGIATSDTAAPSTQLFQHAAVVGMTLVVLIWVLAPVSGAHLNPAVTLAAVVSRRLAPGLAAAYVVVQLAGAIAGTVLADLLFARPALAWGTIDRSGPELWASELVATAGLVGVIFALLATDQTARVGAAVGAWVAAAIYFTSSMSFANPAVTIARMLTDSWTGIVPAHVPAFVAAQMLGAVVAVAAVTWLFRPVPDRAGTSPTPRPVAAADPTRSTSHDHQPGPRPAQPAQDHRPGPQPRVQGGLRDRGDRTVPP